MTTCYLFPAGQNEISRQGYEPGWLKRRNGKPLALDDDGDRQTKILARQLKGKGITRIYCSDVHLSTARVVYSVLRLPFKIDASPLEVTEKLRPFNPGPRRCYYNDEMHEDLKRLIEGWKTKPELNIKNGDSFISYRNRFVRGVEPILNGGGTVVIVLDLRNIRFLRNRVAESLLDDHSIRPDKIYILRREDSDAHTNQQNQAVDIGPERSNSGPEHARVLEVGPSNLQPDDRGSHAHAGANG